MEMEDSKAARGIGITETYGTVEARLLRLEVVVLVSALVLASLVLYGSTQRRSSDRVLRGVMWIAYSLSYVVVTYAVGIIQDGPFHGQTFVLWASALLLIQASAYAAPVHSRRDVDQRKKLLLQHALQTALVLWLILNAIGANTSYRAAIWAFWSLSVVKTAAKIVEMVRSSLPDPSVKVVAEYMDVEQFLAADQLPHDPTTMKGYKYLFHGEEVIQLQQQLSHQYHPSQDEILMTTTTSSVLTRTTSKILTATMSSASPKVKGVVTIDQVYQWINRHGYSDVERDMAKEFCLAFSLFKLLKRRFYGYIPAEAGSPKSLDLVLTGLIHQPVTDPDAAFRVVEAELAFLYDFFYTRNILPVGVRTYIFIAVVMLSLTVWTAFVGTLGPGYSRPPVGVKDLDRSVTVVLVVITAALEVCQALAAFSNNWRYVMAVYRCVRDNRPWTKQRCWKQSITPPNTTYWEQKIGQFELLHWYDHRPWNVRSWVTLYLVEPRRQGQKRGRRKDLPTQVRRAVLDSLKDSRGKLTNGVATVERHGLSEQLTWACVFPKVTDQILVWHVVTTRFDWISGGDGTDDGVGNHRLVARKLSNYCAYLVAFVPEMLPDPSYNAEQIFDTAVQQARDQLAGCRTVRDILAQLDEIQSKEESYLYERAGSSSIIEKAALLGGQLNASVPDEGRRWKVLAEFWAEFVLFLAPSDNVDIHAEMLGAGGEFMTQLWALLSHAGILERPAAATPSAPART
ncbi:hypothetical protein ZWY2020_019278 [Hordeum vulgare]|uniref:DUF4220 domain-containing protein n=1 Tax=Hordeum vulgare subsp. vulgare TaxID=112509 RepID=A0A8I6XW61_HORVV|nr:hypothetical protein ZWY2020_019278 [Hordeum vulgare]